MIYLLFALILNLRWIHTAISITVSTFTIALYYKFYLNDKEKNSFFLIFIHSAVTIYACYFFEKILKQSFLQLIEIKAMNEQTKHVIDSMPDAIMVLDENAQEISIVNYEFRQLLMSEDKWLENQNIKNEILKKPLLKLYNQCSLTQEDSEQLQNDEELGSQANNNKKRCFLEVLTQNIEDQRYEIFRIDRGHQCEQSKIVTLSRHHMIYQNKEHALIIIKNLTQEIQNENLKMENHFYEMLTATVSHDLRTPLNAICGLLNNLDYFIEDSRGKLFLNIIKNSSRFMNFLVNDLLDFFRIKNGKFKLDPRLIDIQDSIKGLIEMFGVGAREKGIDLLYSNEIDFPKKVYIDEQRTQQTLLNLLQNALKFTFSGSIQVHLSYSTEEELIQIEVQDTGIGIKPEDQQKLFQRFGKLEETAHINTTGIGLGLSICKNIVESMNGTIELDATYNKGARFITRIKAPMEAYLYRQESLGAISELDHQEFKAEGSSSINIDIDPRQIKASLMSTMAGLQTPQIEEINILQNTDQEFQEEEQLILMRKSPGRNRKFRNLSLFFNPERDSRRHQSNKHTMRKSLEYRLEDSNCTNRNQT